MTAKELEKAILIAFEYARSEKRIDSFDGSGVSRFPSEMRRINFARRQVDIFRGAAA